MTTGKKVLLTGVILLGGATIFYFAYWRTRNTVLPADVPKIANTNVALAGSAAAVASGVSLSEVESAITSAI